MSENIIQYGSDKQSAIESFQKLLNQYPDKSDIKVNNQARGAQYISIGTVERKLDELFPGLWTIENFRWEVIANELVGSIDLKFYHPITKTWITRVGAGATMILTESGKPATVENKIKNTLVKDFPHLKAECVKNAAKSLGVIFGRNLNRNTDDDFTYISEQVQSYTEGQQEAISLLETAILTEKERTAIEKKINSHRATHKVMSQIVEFLKAKQNGK